MSEADNIIRTVCWRLKVHPADVMRRRGICGARALTARVEIAKRLRDELGMTLVAIGQALDGRHHTTIIHYLRKEAV